MAKRILLLLLSAASLAYYLWIGSNNAFSMSLLSVWPALSVLSLGWRFCRSGCGCRAGCAGRCLYFCCLC